MGGAGDYWNDHREYKRKKRREMIHCWGCHRLVFPGEKCFDCDEVTLEDGLRPTKKELAEQISSPADGQSRRVR